MTPVPAPDIAAANMDSATETLSLADRILRRSLAHVVEQSRLGLITAVVITSALGSLFVPTSGWRRYLLWWALAAGGFTIRQLWFERMRRSREPLTRNQLTRVTVASAITGWLVIASLPVFGPRLPQDQFILLVGLFLAWTTAGVSLLSVQPKVYLGYLVACLSTVMFALWQRFGLADLNVMAIAVPLGGLMMYRLARGIQGLINEAVEEGVRSEALAAQLKVALADAKAAFETRSRFLASASHDLKQPVHALSLLVSVLQRSQNEERKQQVVKEIEQASRSIDTMFSSLMDMARIDAGSMRANPAGVELVPLLKSTLAGFPDACAQKGLGFSLRVEGSPVVYADPLMLQRILANLLDNALKFTVKGQIGVDVAESGGMVSISVSDTGVGISPEEQRTVFQPFARGSQAQVLGISGLGLGLAVVQHMAGLMNMRLDLHSAVGSGSTLVLQMERGVIREVVRLDDSFTTPIAGLRIWLVEDDRIARDATQHWLEEGGARVVAMRSAVEAQHAHLTEPRPDLLIADQNLGADQMSGSALVTWAQLVYPGLPCIVVTGEGSVPLAQASAVLLRKPLSAASLARALQEVMHV